MIIVELPLYELRIQEENGQRVVWGELRKKWLVLTPEEYVRQCLVFFLLKEKSVPRSLISVERGLRYAGMRRRYDLLVYDREAQPLICCECKAPDVAIDQQALRQLSIYNSKIGASHLLLTNGKTLYFLSRGEEGEFELREEIPEFGELL